MAAHNVVIHGKDATTGLPTDIAVINNAASVAVRYPANSYIFADYINNTGTTNNSFQVVNPAGSGVDLVVDSIKLGITAAGSIRLYLNNTQLTTSITATNSGPLDTNGVATSAEFYSQVDITPDGTQFGDINIGANSDYNYPELAGLTIREGDSVCFHCPTDTVLRPVIRYHEETAA